MTRRDDIVPLSKAELLELIRHPSEDRNLNVEIALWLGWIPAGTRMYRRRPMREWIVPGVEHKDGCGFAPLQHSCDCDIFAYRDFDELDWTHSIAGALKLVPAGMLWSLCSGGGYGWDEKPAAAVFAPTRDAHRTVNEFHGSTPAIALCIAAIEATP